MANAAVARTSLELAAKRLEQDLRLRGLQEGDRYTTVAGAAALLGVSQATAYRAMNLMVNRRLLTRKRGRGMFVGAGLGQSGKSVRVRTIYVLLPEDQVDVTVVKLDVMAAAIHRHWVGTNVQLAFVPVEGGLDYVRALIEGAVSLGQLAGVVPLSCSRAVYRYLSEIAAPVVVLGSVYADQADLASVDLDYTQAGFLVASHLIAKGHRRIALLSAWSGRPGDNAFYDGVSNAMTEAHLPANALVMRNFPQELDAFRAQTRELLTGEQRPTAVICRSNHFAGVLGSVATELKLKTPDLEFAFESQAPEIEGMQYVHVQTKLSFGEIADLVVSMLKQLADGSQLVKRRIALPVELCVPR